MSSSNSQSATTDQITWVAEDPGLRGREVGDLATILLVLTIAKENDPVNAILDALWQVLNGPVAYSRPLATRVSIDTWC